MTAELIRVGILGCAHTPHAASYTHWLGQQPNVAVVALYDEDAERAAQFAKRFNINAVHATPAPILDDEMISAVVVCSATFQHADLVIAAARAGKHVLCEKPIATTLADARAMIAACAEAGVQLHIPFVCRFYPTVQRAKRMITDNEVGSVQAMVGGNRGLTPLPPAYPGWITNPVEAGGGALIDHSVHVTDAMRYLTGAEVRTVSAEAGALFNPGLAVDDSALLLLTFDNDAVGSVDPSWSVPKQNPWHYDFFLRIKGSDGLIAIDDTQQALRVASSKNSARGFHLEGFGVNVDEAMVVQFVACLRAGTLTAPAASGEDGLRALEIALAAYESARTGQPVTLPFEPSSADSAAAQQA